MPIDKPDPTDSSAFRFDPFKDEQSIDAYVRECRATGDDEVIGEAEYLASVAREWLAEPAPIRGATSRK